MNRPTPAATRPLTDGAEYAAYAFDFADTADVNHACVQAALAAHGITVTLDWVTAEPVFTARQLRRRLGLPPAALPETTFAEAARAHWFANTDRIQPIAAAATTARTAAEHAAVAVVSANYGHIVRHGLTAVGLDDLPWTVVGRDDVSRTKPAPTCTRPASCGSPPDGASPTRTRTRASPPPPPQACTSSTSGTGPGGERTGGAAWALVAVCPQFVPPRSLRCVIRRR
ncbi:hypothetical protein [Streptomyces acidiscabies]|uniref:Uncharacterized protein n=1 Tax=Streptomyces acidiscabies TaxID=42234 RepID=A0A0L0JE04_9ACTN|nr:hypothetical protein [Streptomyces acidiscabies]KND23689.1 hypothetical protein IQ63_43895 [Streptomyces acidiscabies]